MLTGTALLIVLALSIAMIIVTTAAFKVHPFFALLAAIIFFGLLSGFTATDLINTVLTGFGSIMQQIGLVVSLGCLLGIVLEKTGAVHRISNSIIRLFGERRQTAAMGAIGALVGIPVFCDSGFIILSKLPAAIASQTVSSAAPLSLSLATGLYTTHVLVPPTPGPIAATANIGASDHLGLVILIGLVVAIPVMIVSVFASGRLSSSIALEVSQANERDTQRSPSLLLSFLPIVIPVLLISIASVLDALKVTHASTAVFSVLGQPIVALLIGLLLSFLLITKTDRSQVTGWTNAALKDAGLILLITGLGGSFGRVIKATPIDQVISGWLGGTEKSAILLLVIAFFIAAILKTAQGSSTSSLVISSALIAPFLESTALHSPIGMALVVMALGAGAMTVSHANDSYFWVVSQFSGINPRDMYRSYTALTFIQGITTLIVTVLLFLILL